MKPAAIRAEAVPGQGSRWWRGGAAILGARAADALLRFVLFLATARLLAGPDFSRYALLTAALATAQALCALGTPRTASFFEGRVAPSLLAGWLSAAAVVPSLVVLLLAFVRPLRVMLFPALSADLLLLGLAPLPFLLLGDSLFAIAVARRRDRLYGPIIWGRSAATAAVLATSLLASDRLRWLLAGRIVVAVVVALALLQLLSSVPTLRGLRTFAAGAAGFALPAAAGGALASLHRRADVFLLSALGRTPEIGPYAVAYTLAEAFWIVTDSLEASLFVDLARLETDEAKRETRRAVVAYAGIAALATLGLVVGRMILRVAFARDYPAAVDLFFWVLLAAIFLGASRPFSSFLYSRNRGSRVAAAYAGGLALNIALCVAWIPSMGAMGAARATFVSYAFQAVALGLFSRGRFAPPEPAEGASAPGA